MIFLGSVKVPQMEMINDFVSNCKLDPDLTGRRDPDAALSPPSLQTSLDQTGFVLKHETATFILTFLPKSAQMLCYPLPCLCSFATTKNTKLQPAKKIGNQGSKNDEQG